MRIRFALRSKALGYLLLSAVLTFATQWPCHAQQQAAEKDKPLDNADIVAMRQSGIGESVIVAAIKYSPMEKLDSSAPALARLRNAGAGEAVVAALRSRVETRQNPAASTETLETGGQATHAQGPADVKLYFTDKPTAKFRELGRVSSGKYNVIGRSRKRDAIDEELRTKAAEMGGDAVINISEDFASVSGVVIVFER